MVTVVVPLLILRGEDPAFGWWSIIGAALIAAGFALWVWTVRLFARIGEGTLAPWDPTRNLVVAGPYRYVRNPMISAVIAVLLGEAVFFGAPALAIWCAVFFVVNALGFLVYEEPGLEQRFGEPYQEYKRNVPRWLPRRKPWSQPDRD